MSDPVKSMNITSGDLGMDILEFSGEYRWLSNFWTCKVTLDGVSYASVENAYQAAKTAKHFRTPFESCNAAQAKKLGRLIGIRPDWDLVKIDVMRSLIEQKFEPGSELALRLVNTGNVLIVEGNSWGDTFWGVCKGRGLNKLGEILMVQRMRLSSDVA